MALPIVGEYQKPQTRAAPVGRLKAYAVRVSVLDQCQLRCSYCEPGAVRPFTAKEGFLEANDYRRLANALRPFGVRKVRFTGGEPLLRPDLVEIVGAWAQELPQAELALTTNGLGLEERVPDLWNAGLRRLNVHLDTLSAERYRKIMGRGTPDEVLAGAKAALVQGFDVKLNIVVQKDVNDDELLALLELGQQLGLTVRFIEQMDTGSAPDHVKATFLSGAEILAALGEPMSLGRHDASDPAERFRTSSGHEFGLIASDTRPFCDACDRLRITPKGELRGCLYEPGGLAIRDALRTDDPVALTELVSRALDGKRSWHPEMVVSRPAFSMSEIGG